MMPLLIPWDLVKNNFPKSADSWDRVAAPAGKIFFENNAHALKEVRGHFFAGDVDPIERPRPGKAAWRVPTTSARWGCAWSSTVDSAQYE